MTTDFTPRSIYFIEPYPWHARDTDINLEEITLKAYGKADNGFQLLADCEEGLYNDSYLYYDMREDNPDNKWRAEVLDVEDEDDIEWTFSIMLYDLIRRGYLPYGEYIYKFWW